MSTVSHMYKYAANASFGVKLSVSVGLAFAFYYKTRVCKVPVIIGKQGQFKKFVLEHIPTVHERFAPFFLLFGSSLQTIAGAVFKREPVVRWDELEEIDLPDKGQVHLDWMHNNTDKKYTKEHRPTVLLLPGLTGNNESNYICEHAKICEKLGYRAVVFTYRGMAKGKSLKTAKTYCACYTGDLDELVNRIVQRFPEAPLMAVGTSLGGMILFHYLVNKGADSKLLAAMTVSVPWNPFESMKTLSTPLNRILFNRRLTRKLINMAETNAHHFEGLVNFDHLRESNTIHEFDESFTARVFGFESLDHYYSSARISDKVFSVKTPTLMLNSMDDPFSPGYSIPVDDINKTENLALVLTERGGHVGFIDTFFARGDCYMDRMFEQYVTAAFNNQDLLKQAQ